MSNCLKSDNYRESDKEKNNELIYKKGNKEIDSNIYTIENWTAVKIEKSHGLSTIAIMEN